LKKSGITPTPATGVQRRRLHKWRARRRDISAKTSAIRAALRGEQLAQPPAVTAACAAVVRSLIAVITTLSEQIKALERQVAAHFSQHPDAEIIMSQPGLGPVLGARVLAEFGDDPHRYASGKARKNYAATSPITRQSGERKTVMAWYVHNDRLLDALDGQAFAALTASRGARAC
jgi:transposase